MLTDRRTRGPVPAVLGALAEPIYRRVLARRNARWDRGEGVQRMPVPVISVGNLSVGGTGKTPMVWWVVEKLREADGRPMIALRGYKSAGGASDEETEHRRRFAGDVPVVADPDRAASITESAAAGACDIAVLDDGFQHRRVARDLDIVLLDATRRDWSGRCLPAGWLREPVDALSRADAIVLTRTDRVDQSVLGDAERAIRRAAPSVHIAHAAHRWTGMSMLGEHGWQSVGLDHVMDARVCVGCGIGHPAAFVEHAQHEGASINAVLALDDHAAWNESQARRLAAEAHRAQCDVVLITRKDAVKLERVWEHAGNGMPLLVAEVGIGFRSGEAKLEELVRRAAAGD